MRYRLARFGFLALTGLLAASPAATPAQAPLFAYAPGTQHYRLTTSVHRNQFQGGGRAPFEFDATTTQLITLAIERQSADTLRLTITIDSVAVSSTLDAPMPNTNRFVGTKITGLISPTGQIYAFDPPAGNTDPQLAALYAAFRRFLVSFPPRPLTVGTSWADTTIDHVQRNGFDVAIRNIGTTTVAGDTTVNGTRAWRIVRHAEIAQQGEKNENGYPIQLLGEGTVNGVHLVSSTGVYLGSQSTQRFNLTMTMKDSEGAPINETIKSTVERVQ